MKHYLELLKLLMELAAQVLDLMERTGSWPWLG